MLTPDARATLLDEVRALHIQGGGLTGDLIRRITEATDPTRSLRAAADTLDEGKRIWTGDGGASVEFEPRMARTLPLTTWLRLRAEHGADADAWATANLCGLGGCTLAYGHDAALDAPDHSYLPRMYPADDRSPA